MPLTYLHVSRTSRGRTTLALVDEEIGVQQNSASYFSPVVQAHAPHIVWQEVHLWSYGPPNGQPQ